MIGAIEMLKSPVVGNSTSVGVAAVLAFLLAYPSVLPYASADEVKALESAMVKTVRSESIRVFVDVLSREINDTETKIELELCIQAGCAYERSQLKRAINRKKDLTDELVAVLAK
jgi:hypothetical protein